MKIEFTGNQCYRLISFFPSSIMEMERTQQNHQNADEQQFNHVTSKPLPPCQFLLINIIKRKLTFLFSQGAVRIAVRLE